MADVEKEPEFRVLSLAGGGYLGFYTACVLVDLEEQAGEPLGRRFDLIAGTSVGGILAIALAFEIPMAQIREIFLEQGTRIFSSRGLPNNPVAKLRDLTRSVMGPKYNGIALNKALAKHLGRKTLGDALHSVVVPAVNITLSQTKVFKSPHASGSRGDQGTRAASVAMATSAAPAYFPAVRVGPHLYADGGLFAVAPDQVAMHEAEHFMRVDASRIRMLSIGTATMGYRPSSPVAKTDGAVDWLADGRLLLTLISVQQQHVQAMVEDRLRDRYARLDAEWPQAAELGIDVATPEAADVLEQLAQQTLKDPRTVRVIRRFLARDS